MKIYFKVNDEILKTSIHSFNSAVFARSKKLKLEFCDEDTKLYSAIIFNIDKKEVDKLKNFKFNHGLILIKDQTKAFQKVIVFFKDEFIEKSVAKKVVEIIKKKLNLSVAILDYSPIVIQNIMHYEVSTNHDYLYCESYIMNDEFEESIEYFTQKDKIIKKY